MIRFWCWTPDDGGEESGFCVAANDAEEAAQEAAEWDHDNRDGYERGRKVDWHVRQEGDLSTVRVINVERDYSPVFYAAPEKLQPVPPAAGLAPAAEWRAVNVRTR